VAIIADVPLFAAIGKAVAMYMVAVAMRAYRCSLIDLGVPVAGLGRLFNKLYDPLKILLCKIPAHFRHCLKVARFLFIA
jgi:hypothetical protein